MKWVYFDDHTAVSLEDYRRHEDGYRGRTVEYVLDERTGERVPGAPEPPARQKRERDAAPPSEDV